MTTTDNRVNIRSRFCAICDSQFRWQCTCPNNRVMAKQKNQSFKQGKRYKGKKALEYCMQPEEKKDEEL